VIQTHGFKQDKFWIDGPWSGAFAAQPLASKGFVVLQVGSSVDPWEDEKYANTLQEVDRHMAAYEGAVDYLDKRGIVDREKVGLIGFSITTYYLAYTLTHSKHHFAAATLADGFDGEKMNVFTVFDARLNVIKVIHRLATEWSAGVISSEVCSASVCQTGLLPFASAMGRVHMLH